MTISLSIRNQFLIVLFSMCMQGTAFAKPLHVLLDPGHGGTDDGAVMNKVKESDVTLGVAKILASRLKKDSRFQVSLTRHDDSYLSLEKRAEIGNAVGDIFLSIHVNSSTDKQARGQEIYFQNHLPADEETLYLASRENDGKKSDVSMVPREVQFLFADRPNLTTDVKAIVEDLARSHRLQLSSQFAKELFYNWKGEKYKKTLPIRQAPFYVISNVTKPAVLVEIGYLSNEREAKLLIDNDYQERVAEGLQKGLIRYKEFIDNNESSSLN